MEKETRIKRISLRLSMCDDDESVQDEKLYYKNISRFDFLDIDSDDFYTFRCLELTNVSDDNVDFLIHREYGENKINFSQMEVSAFDERKNRLSVGNMVNVQPCIIQTFKLIFPATLKPKESTKVFLKFKWMHELLSFSGDTLNASISILRYLRGVERLNFGVKEFLDLTQVLSGLHFQGWTRRILNFQVT